MFGRIEVVAFESSDIPRRSLCPLWQPSVCRSGIGQEDIVRCMLVYAGEVELSDVQVPVGARAIERLVSTTGAGDGHSILSQEVSRPKATNPKNADALQAEFASHETTAEVKIAVVTSTARQSKVAIRAADQRSG